MFDLGTLRIGRLHNCKDYKDFCYGLIRLIEVFYLGWVALFHDEGIRKQLSGQPMTIFLTFVIFKSIIFWYCLL